MLNTFKFDGQSIIPTPKSPWMLAIKLLGHYTLWGASFIKERRVGLASSSAFDDMSIDTLSSGAYYIDTTTMNNEFAETIHFNGPVVDIDLPPLSIRPLNSIITFADMIEVIQSPHTLQVMTAVSIDVYAQIWRVMGAKIGRCINKNIVWEQQINYTKTSTAN